MTANWLEVTLADVAADVTVGHVGPMADQYRDGGIPFLRSLNVEPYRINTSGMMFIGRDFHARLRKSALRPGDVLIVRTGKPGACAVVPDWLPDANCSDLVIVRPGPLVRPEYISYVVNATATHHIDAHLVGAVQQHFNVGSARQIKFRLPPLIEQDRVIAILGALDDKIELNRRMNETLEAMARAIFKDWFVDFGPTRAKMEGRAPYLAPEIWSLFPDRLDDTGKPLGWITYTLGDIADQIKGAISPEATPDELFEHFSLPAFDAGRSPALDLGASIKSNKTVVPANAVLLSKLNPEISRVWLPEPKSLRRQIASTEFLSFQPRHICGRGFIYCLFESQPFRAMLEAMVTGTSRSHQRISPPALLRREVAVGTSSTFSLFERVIAPLIDMSLGNGAESRTLAATRDVLLPKLMSGEIRMKDAERVVEAAA